jgi:DNA-binding MarR family transcriptional regulator
LYDSHGDPMPRRPASTPDRDSSDEIPLEQIIHIAEFRAKLRAFLLHNEKVARRFGLTPQRFQLLLAIKGAPDGSERLSVTDLAGRLGLSRNTVTELCARAEQIGLVVRQPAQHDLRVVYLRVTAKGNKLLFAALRENDAYRQELLRAFDELSESFAVTERWVG